MAAPLIQRTAMIDDDGSGEVGTVLNNAWKQELYNQIDAIILNASYGTVLSSTATGTVNNWAPGLSGNTAMIWTGAADLTVTGIAGGTVGQTFTFRNIGTKVAYFVPNTGSSLNGNRFYNPIGGAPLPVAVNGSISYVYDGTWWQCIHHAQGNWIAPPYLSTNFSASASMTWTVTAGNMTQCVYRVDGTTVRVKVNVVATKVGGTVSSQLFISCPAYGNFTAKSSGSGGNGFIPGAAMVMDNSGGAQTQCYVQIAGTFVVIAKYAGGNFTLSNVSGQTDVYTEFCFEAT